MPTIRQSLQNARPRMPDPNSATLDAQLLLAFVLGVERPYVLAHDERELTPQESQDYEQVVNRRAHGEPYAYIIGQQAFYDLNLRVSPAVLIPRSETELLVEEALRWAQSRSLYVSANHSSANTPLHIADIGTGSGAIALTLAKHLPHAHVWATDISPDALAIAQANAHSNGLPQVTFWQGDLATPLIENNVRVDILTANLPYIPTNEMKQLPVSQYEPHLALDGGDDGLDVIRRLVTQLPQVCKPESLILLEIGAGQGDSVCQIVQILHAQALEILYDYARHDRIVRIAGCNNF
jgi:release factor glutamine methyltransferase